MASLSFSTGTKTENAELVRKFRKLGYNVNTTRCTEQRANRVFTISLDRKARWVHIHSQLTKNR